MFSGHAFDVTSSPWTTLLFSCYVSVDAGLRSHVDDVAEGMLELGGSPLVKEDVDVNIWRSLFYIELQYVANLSALPAEWFNTCHDMYIVYRDPICWH